jgi:hypothetical protein
LTRAQEAFSLGGMNVDLTADQKALVQQAIDSGRLHRPEDAAKEAFSLWAERERRRIVTREEMAQFADEIKQRGLSRLNAEQTGR